MCRRGLANANLAWNKMECQATLVCGAEVGECNEWSRKNFEANEWNEPIAGTRMWVDGGRNISIFISIPTVYRLQVGSLVKLFCQ